MIRIAVLCLAAVEAIRVQRGDDKVVQYPQRGDLVTFTNLRDSLAEHNQQIALFVDIHAPPLAAEYKPGRWLVRFPGKEQEAKSIPKPADGDFELVREDDKIMTFNLTHPGHEKFNQLFGVINCMVTDEYRLLVQFDTPVDHNGKEISGLKMKPTNVVWRSHARRSKKEEKKNRPLPKVLSANGDFYVGSYLIPIRLSEKDLSLRNAMEKVAKENPNMSPKDIVTTARYQLANPPKKIPQKFEAVYRNLMAMADLPPIDDPRNVEILSPATSPSRSRSNSLDESRKSFESASPMSSQGSTISASSSLSDSLDEVGKSVSSSSALSIQVPRRLSAFKVLRHEELSAKPTVDTKLVRQTSGKPFDQFAIRAH